MKGSIAIKIFIATVASFLFVLLIQWFVINGSFNGLYFRSILSSMERELSSAIQGYKGGDEEASFLPLSNYSLKTGSPVLVFDKDYRITDQDIFNRMDLLHAKLYDGKIVKIPVGSIRKLLPDKSRTLPAGNPIHAKLVQVGNSSFYEPLTLTINHIPYTNRESMREYTVVSPEIKKLESPAAIIFHRAMSTSAMTQGKRAQMIYDNVKDCLIKKSDIDSFLDDLCHSPMMIGQDSYQFMYKKVRWEHMDYYFVTVQKIVVTGFEKAYVNSFFYMLYALLGSILIAAAYLLARHLSRPLEHLSTVAEKIANLDFTQEAEYKSNDELGRLSENINTMSANLESALNNLEGKNEELTRASQLAEENEKRMELLLADLAHEFKTPLGLISGFMEVIQNGIGERNQDYYFNVISEEISQLTDMINEAIDLTKVRSGSWSIHVEDCSFSHIANTAMKKFRQKIEDQGFNLKTELTDAVVRADSHRITQVMSNFISNALKYADENRKIEITSQVQEKSLLVFIGNSGSISPENLDKIWERDYGSDTFRQVRLPSQGIGLDIVRTILLAHNSRYGVLQESGMVYFYFTLELE